MVFAAYDLSKCGSGRPELSDVQNPTVVSPLKGVGSGDRGRPARTGRRLAGQIGGTDPAPRRAEPSARRRWQRPGRSRSPLQLLRQRLLAERFVTTIGERACYQSELSDVQNPTVVSPVWGAKETGQRAAAGAALEKIKFDVHTSDVIFRPRRHVLGRK